jgi:hypothetical protein
MTGTETLHTMLHRQLYETAMHQLDDAASHIGEQRLRIKKLEALLADCAEFLEPYSDVSDGAYGDPVPNAAMSLLSEINEAIP